MRVLVVDDSQSVRMLIGRLGLEFDMETIEAGDGMEGLDRLNSMAAPDLIIADWRMPRMEGSEFVQIVRENPLYNRTFILMFTSESGLDQIQKALQWGVDDYLMKPCTGQDIRNKLEAVSQHILAVQRALG